MCRDASPTRISRWRARYAQIEGNGQANMALLLRFSGAAAVAVRGDRSRTARLPSARAELLRQHNASWLNLWNAICGLLLRSAWRDGARFRRSSREHRLASVQHTRAGQADDRDDRKSGRVWPRAPTPGSIGRSERPARCCAKGMHYALVALHIRIQTGGGL